MRHRDRFSLTRAAKDGGTMSTALSLLILISLKINPEMWVNDYPPDIRAAFGSKSKKAQRQGGVVAIFFFGIIFSMVVLANRRLKNENGGFLSFKTAFWHTYTIFATFWLVDLIILDWLIFVTLNPDFLILPGTAGMPGYDDYGFHLRVSIPALALMGLPAGVVAFFMRNK